MALHGKDSNVAIWRYMARMRKEERMQKGARQWCIIPVPQSASATFSLAASKMSICPDQKSKTFPAQKMHCKRSAILKMVLSHGFNWNPLPEWQVSLACNLFFWQRGVFLISREQMKEKCPACSEQSINTFYQPIAGSLQARVTPFKMLYLLLTKLMHVTASWGHADQIQLN